MNLIGQIKDILKDFLRSPRISRISVVASLLRERVSRGGVCVHAPGEGRLGEGPPLSGINSRGRRGTRQKAAGGERRQAAGGGPEKGAETRSGVGSKTPECLGDPGRLSGRAASGYPAARALAGALRSPVPRSSLRPRAQGKEGRGVPPSLERGQASVPGAVRPPQVVTSFFLPRPLPSSPRHPEALGDRSAGTRTLGHPGFYFAVRGPVSFPTSLPPLRPGQLPEPDALGEHLTRCVRRKHPRFPSNMQRFPG